MHIKYSTFDMKKNKYAFAPAVYICLFVISLTRIFDLEGLTDYNRDVSIASVVNFDIGATIHRFYLAYIIIIPLIFLISLYLICKIYKRIESNHGERAVSFFKLYSLEAICFSICIVLEMSSLKLGTKVSDLYIYLAVLMVVQFVYPMIRRVATCYSELKMLVLLATQILFVCQLYINNSVRLVILIVGMIVFLLALLLVSIKYENMDRIINACTPMSYLLLLSALGLELSVILTQYGFYIWRSCWIPLIVLLLLLVLSIGLFLCKYKVKLKDHYNIGLVLGVVAWAGLPKITSVVNTDLFEQANLAVPTSQFVLFGKIPFVESLSAHLVSDWLSGIVYYLFNRDYLGSLFSPYFPLLSLIWVIVFYYLLSKIIDKDMALIIAITVSASGNLLNGPTWQSLSLVSVISIIIIANRQSFCRYFWFWLLIALGVCIRADVGMSVGIGIVCSYIIYAILKKEKINILKAVSAFGVVVLIFVGAFTITCFVKGVSVVSRIREFVDVLGASNELWARVSIGQDGSFGFVLVYVIIPVVVCLLLIAVILSVKFSHNSAVSKINYIMTMSMGFAYVINLQRILVRHNYLECGTFIMIFGTGALFIGLALNVLLNNKAVILIPISIFLVTGFSLMGTKTDYNYDSAIDKAFDNLEEVDVKSQYRFIDKVNRVEISEAMKNKYEPLVSRINEILEDGETFVDFSNQSLIYSLSKRESPVYVSESPGLVSGEKSQESFIEEVDRLNPPILISAIDKNVLFGTQIDDVNINYRLYKIAEFINENYLPMEQCNEYMIWVKRDRIDVANKLNTSNQSIIVNDNLHTYELGQVPYLWGQLDVKKSKENEVLSECNNIREKEYDCEIPNEKSSYICFELECENADTDISLILGNEKEEYITFKFKGNVGDNTYMIRPSVDCLWDSKYIDRMRFEVSQGVTIKNLRILAGD